MKNEDNECFRWCHIRHLNPQEKDPQRIKNVHKPFINQLDYSNIEFPVDVKQYNNVEKQNKIEINSFLDMKKNNHSPFTCHKRNLITV